MYDSITNYGNRICEDNYNFYNLCGLMEQMMKDFELFDDLGLVEGTVDSDLLVKELSEGISSGT